MKTATGPPVKVIDYTKWRSYERTFRNEQGLVDGKCRWSAPPPIQGEGDPDVMIYDDETKQMVAIPDGFCCPRMHDSLDEESEEEMEEQVVDSHEGGT